MLIDPRVAGWLLVLVGLVVFATQEHRHLVLSFNMATQLLIRILDFSLTQQAHYPQICRVQSLLEDNVLSQNVFDPSAKHDICRKSTGICVFIYYLL
jgi:hypothetical protein